MEFQRWNNGWAERRLEYVNPPAEPTPHLKQSIVINISCGGNLSDEETFYSFVWFRTKLQWSLTKEIMTVGAQTIRHDGSHLSPLTDRFNAFFLAPSLHAGPTQPMAARVHRCTTLAAFITLSFWIIGGRWTGRDDWRIPAKAGALRRVLAGLAPRGARQERAGQVSGRRAALIGEVGIPYPPSTLTENNTSVLKWKVIHLRKTRGHPVITPSEKTVAI